jgi:hypothetical protein
MRVSRTEQRLSFHPNLSIIFFYSDYQMSNKYRRYDVTVSLQTVHTDLTDIEQDINLRILLWESQQNWN